MVTKLMNLKTFIFNKNIKFLCVLIIIGLLIVGGLIVYMSGGTSAALTHIMYIPILITLFIFGIKQGILVSVAAGIIVGPYMPMDISKGLMQETRFWVLRMIMYVIITVIVGRLVEYVKKFNDEENTRAYKDIMTGYPNANKFKYDLNKYIKEKKCEKISLLSFHFKNKAMVTRYINHEASQKSFMNLLAMAEDHFKESGKIYVMGPEQFTVLLCDCRYIDAFEMAKKYYTLTRSPIYVNTLPISVTIKGGMVFYPLHSTDADELIEKMNKALDKACMTQKNIIVYNSKYVDENTKYHNTLLSIYHSLNNRMFKLVYQPKVQLCDNEIAGVEALLRIKDNNANISLEYLIKIAEDLGFITDITKWVIDEAVSQIKKWQKNGLFIKVAINLSSMDLVDDSIVQYTKSCLYKYEVDAEYLEFELTERTIIEDERTVISILRKIKMLGIKLSIDDYGSGYNSLLYLVDNLFQFDFIKIDKLFVDNLQNKQNEVLMKGIIDTAHVLNKKVIAEGVEREEQIKILKNIGCDIVQGYYYSKPLSNEEIVLFIEKIKIF